MNNNPILACLAAISDDVSTNIEFVNHGGCAVFASIVGKHLERVGVSAGIVAHDRRAGDPNAASVDEARANIRAAGKDPTKRGFRTGPWRSNGVGFNHVGVELTADGQSWHYGSTGAAAAGRHEHLRPVFRGRLTVAEAAAMAANPGNWNDIFDRSQIPAMRKIVARHFRNLKRRMKRRDERGGRTAMAGGTA